MTTDQMNPILRNIYEQPDELDRAHKIARAYPSPTWSWTARG